MTLSGPVGSLETHLFRVDEQGWAYVWTWYFRYAKQLDVE